MENQNGNQNKIIASSDSFAAIFLFIFLAFMWGLGFQNDSPAYVHSQAPECALTNRTNHILGKIEGGFSEGGFFKYADLSSVTRAVFNSKAEVLILR